MTSVGATFQNLRDTFGVKDTFCAKDTFGVNPFRRDSPTPEAIPILEESSSEDDDPFIHRRKSVSFSLDDSPSVSRDEVAAGGKNSIVVTSSKANRALRRVRDGRRDSLRRMEAQAKRILELEAEVAILRSKQALANLQSVLNSDVPAKSTKVEKAEDASTDSTSEESRSVVVGGSGLKNTWDQVGSSVVMRFPSPNTATCGPMKPIEEVLSPSFSPARMPGFCAKQAMDSGLYTVTLSLKGDGDSMVGLVSTTKDKDALQSASFDIDDPSEQRLRWMALLPSIRAGERTVTMQVDMVNHRAELFLMEQGEQNDIGQQEPYHVWNKIPSKVWLACALERNSAREVKLVSSTHWEV